MSRLSLPISCDQPSLLQDRVSLPRRARPESTSECEASRFQSRVVVVLVQVCTQAPSIGQALVDDTLRRDFSAGIVVNAATDLEKLNAAVSTGYARGKLFEAAKTLPRDRLDESPYGG
jgi:hypothetical protein